jgi:TonB family protein
MSISHSSALSPSAARVRLGGLAVCAAVALGLPLFAQQPAPETNPQPETPVPAALAQAAPTPPLPGEITEAALKQLLVGKPLYLRGGYLDNTLTFNEHGVLIGHSPQGSFTLSGIEIDKVRLTKHKLELEGVRYGLHFLSALSYEENAPTVDRVRITPKKKEVKITIDRELVISRRTKKESAKEKDKKAISVSPAKTPTPAPATAAQNSTQANAQNGTQIAPDAATAADSANAVSYKDPSDANQLKAEIAAAPAAERPIDPGSVTATFSPAHAADVLKDALARVFAWGIDDRLIASMPAYWQLYYQALAANAVYRPADPAVLCQNAVDKKARLVSTFQPESNEYARANAVSGMALYHTVIGPDGKPEEIAVGRPIGFGLDENAVEAIHKASFEPAIKDGKPVPVMLDLVVEFHIYSNTTGAPTHPEDVAKPEEAAKPVEPSLPGPYSVPHP